MALFVIFVGSLMVGLWNTGALRARYLALALPFVLSSLFFSEVKIALFLIPLAVVGMYGFDLIRRPVVSTAILIGSGLLIGAIYLSYGTLFAENTAGTGGLESGTKFSFDPGMIKANGEMGRYAALNYWWNHGGDSVGPMGYVLGNGLGSSNSDNPMELGVIARRVAPIHIAATGAVKLLWEAGVVGLAAYLIILLFVYVTCRALMKDSNDAFIRGLLAGFAAMCAMSAMHIFYTKTVVGHTPHVYLLIVILVGTTMLLKTQSGSRRMQRKRVRA